MLSTSKSQPFEFVSKFLESLILTAELANPHPNVHSNSLTLCFYSFKLSTVTLDDYFTLIHNHAKCSSSCYVIAFIYIVKFLMANPLFILNKVNVQKVIATAMVIAIKYNDDSYVDNEDFADAIGMTLEELNEAEVSMLTLLEFETFVSPEVYLYYEEMLNQEMKKILESKINADIFNGKSYREIY